MIDMKLTTRAAPFVSSTLDTANRTVDLTWTTGARVLRGRTDAYYEELSLDPAHVRMQHLQSGGAPLLDSHDASGIQSIIGVVENARLEKGRGVATVRFDGGPRGEDAMRRVGEGTLSGVSVGYSIKAFREVDDPKADAPVYRATDWTPRELSLTAIGADAGANVRNQEPDNMTTKNRTNPPAEIAHLIDRNGEPLTTRAADDDGTEPREQPTAIAADRERSAAISRLTRNSFMSSMAANDRAEIEQLGDRLIRDGVPLERAKARIMDEVAERGTISFDKRDPRIQSGRDLGERRIELMAEALVYRAGGPKPSDEAQQYVRLPLTDIARHLLEVQGVNTRMMSKNQIIERSITGGTSTGDFPHLLTDTGNRLLLNAYGSYQGGLKRACKGPVPAPDFRPLQKLRLGEAAPLQKVNQLGEFTRNNSMVETKEAYSLSTYGKIYSMSRQALVNDDLSAFTDMATKLGRSATEFVASQLVALLVSNPVLGQDATAVFHATHGNLAGSGSVISVASLGAGLASMRLQKGLDGTTPIDVTPKFLIVPAALETVALQTIAQITPNQVANVNPFSGKLELIVEPRLDASSAITWYLAADPGLVDGIEYAFLDGAGPTLQLRLGFDVDGMEWKIFLDFGAGILDFKGLYKNPGA